MRNLYGLTNYEKAPAKEQVIWDIEICWIGVKTEERVITYLTRLYFKRRVVYYINLYSLFSS